MTRTLLLSAAAAACLTLPALADTKTYDVDPFTKIDARVAVEVIATVGADRSVSVEQAEGDFSDIFLSVEDGELLVARKSGKDNRGWYKSVNIETRADGTRIAKVNGKRVPWYTVRVTVPALDAATAANSGDLTVTGISAGSFTGSVSSSGDLSVSGTAAKTTLAASSSGDLDASGLVSTVLDVDASSSADVMAAAGGGDVTIDVSSSADVDVSGTCSAVTIQASSGADADLSGLACQNADIQASSGADIDANVTSSAKVRASSGADVSLSGGATRLDLKDSSGADISVE